MNKITVLLTLSIALSSAFVTTQAVANGQDEAEKNLVTIAIGDAIKFFGTFNGDENTPGSYTFTEWQVNDQKTLDVVVKTLVKALSENKDLEDQIWNMTGSEALWHVREILIHSAKLGCASSVALLKCLKRALCFIGEHGKSGIEKAYGVSRRQLKKRYPDANWNKEWDFDNDNKAGQASPNANLIASRKRAAFASLGQPNSGY